MHDEVIRIPSRHGRVTLDDDARALLQRRADAVAACLHALPIDLPWKFLAELAPLLQPPAIREVPAPPEEIPLIRDLLVRIAAGPDRSDPGAFPRSLAVAMFYFLPHELPQTPPPSQLPLWIRVPYVKWSLARLQCCLGPAEADRHARWLADWRNVLAGEFIEGRGMEDVPEYQRPRMRRLVEQLCQFEEPPANIR
jgi:hypothetical protein